MIAVETSDVTWLAQLNRLRDGDLLDSPLAANDIGGTVESLSCQHKSAPPAVDDEWADLVTAAGY